MFIWHSPRNFDEELVRDLFFTVAFSYKTTEFILKKNAIINENWLQEKYLHQQINGAYKEVTPYIDT